VFDFSLSVDDLTEMSSLHENPKKLIRFEDLPNKFTLPDGYKLAGRVYGVPYQSTESNSQMYPNMYATAQNVC
ncbi:hypothetical protein TELCIR_18627, partial [Teladorsagia circumcincta]